MDEKLVEQISTDTGVPQELVSRSRFLELYSTEQFLESLLGLFRRLL